MGATTVGIQVEGKSLFSYKLFYFYAFTLVLLGFMLWNILTEFVIIERDLPDLRLSNSVENTERMGLQTEASLPNPLTERLTEGPN